MTDFDHTQIDETIHSSRLRVAIMAVLAAVEWADFTFLREKTKATDGNLGWQLQGLEKAGYVKMEKRTSGRRVVTEISLTRKGRAAFSAYFASLEALCRPKTEPPE